MWRLARTRADRDLAIVPSWVAIYAIAACYVVMSAVLWMIGSRVDDPLIVVFGSVALHLFCAIMLLLTVARMRGGPYLVVRGDVIRGRVPGVDVPRSSIVAVETITGRPRHTAGVRELNLLYRHADGTIRRLPVVGGLGREVDALAATLADTLSVPLFERSLTS